MAKVTRADLLAMKAQGKRIVVVTAYDWSAARLFDAAGVDVLLVGDSLGNVVQGHGSTLPVTVDHMVYHTACVARARPAAMVVADLPFGTFQRGPAAALDCAIRLVQEGGAEAVKIEGAGERLHCIETVVRADIPVWGHLGLTPQSVHALSGYRVQGKDEDSAARLAIQAKDIEAAGASALVLECIPWELGRAITAQVQIPTIGIGAGVHCDGQVLVSHDLLGLTQEFVPKFVQQYARLGDAITAAVRQFAADVRAGTFPSLEQSYGVAGGRREATKGARGE